MNTLMPAAGKVYVSIDNPEELLLPPRARVLPCNWVDRPQYEFRLYDSDHTRLLDKCGCYSD